MKKECVLFVSTMRKIIFEHTKKSLFNKNRLLIINNLQAQKNAFWGLFRVLIFTFFTASFVVLAGCKKKNEPTNEDSASQDKIAETVTDICGNTYNYVKIGSQYWMAENMRCNKYDTESERPNATISTSDYYIYAPYYVDDRDKSKWHNNYIFTDQLSDEQMQKLGYLYNWAAAVGLATEDEVKAQTSSFKENRQGICPNGWHIPTSEESKSLAMSLGDPATTGKCLKTTSGWHDSGNGTDSYGFAALPAGFFDTGGVRYIGKYAEYWAASIVHTSGKDVFVSCFTLNSDGDSFGFNSMTTYIGFALSVRCVKN